MKVCARVGNCPLVLLMGALLLCVGCGQTNATLVLTCPSPTGELVAVVVHRGGGGAAGWTETTLAVVPFATDAAEVIADRDHLAGVMVLNGETDVRLRWYGVSRLHVEFPDTRTLFFAAPRGSGAADDLRITYASAAADTAVDLSRYPSGYPPGYLPGQLPGGAACESVASPID